MSMPAALARRRDYTGPALLSYGFRPFFLAAGLWAAFGILLWLPQYVGEFALPTQFGALDWHIHEMLYGYVAATIAGSLARLACPKNSAAKRSASCRRHSKHGRWPAANAVTSSRKNNSV